MPEEVEPLYHAASEGGPYINDIRLRSPFTAYLHTRPLPESALALMDFTFSPDRIEQVWSCKRIGQSTRCRKFTDAGFTQVRIHDEETETLGILWNTYVPGRRSLRHHFISSIVPSDHFVTGTKNVVTGSVSLCAEKTGDPSRSAPHFAASVVG